MNSSIWNKFEQLWPAIVNGQSLSYQTLLTQVTDFLRKNSIEYLSLSHFGVVTPSIERTLEAINNLAGKPEESLIKDYVEAYQVFVARMKIQKIELELIEPVGKTFFAISLEERGTCLQHISFEVKDIDKSVKILKNLAVPLVDEEPIHGSHGKIAFTQPVFLGPLYLELCQKKA